MSRVDADLRSSLARKVNRLSNSLVYPAWNLNLEEIEKSIYHEIQSDSTFAIIVRKDDGTVLAGSLKTPQVQVVPYVDSETDRRTLATSYANESRPITKNNVTIGSVSVYISDIPMRDSLREEFWDIVIKLLTLTTILSLSIYFSLKRLIISPINDLEKSVRSISFDNFAPIIASKRDDEIGRLSESFRQMSSALHESFSAQKALTDVLRKQDKQFRTITSNVPGAIYRLAEDQSQGVVYMSDNIKMITGFPAADFTGNSRAFFRTMVMKEDLATLNEAVQHAIEFTSSYDIKYRLTDKEGKTHWIHEIGQCSCTDGERFLDGVLIDDTELHEKDALLVQSQKMETVGVLAGGIAHDFNNILAGIMGAVSMLKLKLPVLSDTPRDNVDKYIALIEKSSLRAADMTRQLLSLSKPQEMKLAPTDLCTSLQHVNQICLGTLDKVVSLSTDFDVESAPVNVDPVQIEQVLINLCINAAHAVTIMRPPSVPWGGNVHITLSRIYASAESHLLHPAAQNIDYWEVTVADTGIGMDAKTLTNIFTPFYTTKPKGAGSGLGLSMAYTIISQHNGFITVNSEPGKGSAFRLYLPVLDATLGNYSSANKASDEIPLGTGTVLVIDDEEMLRDNASQILGRCGYTVLIATNGEEGLQQMEAHGDEIGLVLLDMVMPVLSGKETFYRIKERHPHVKILLSSGNRSDERVEELLKAGVVDFIGKPYSLPELARAVQRLMQQGQKQ
jgi:signal transduction histidine kinase/ActR/RegA family two-component response regulator